MGHVRDVRRLIVALSRARLGLYIFGRQKLFQNCHELEPAFTRLLKRPTKLCLKTGEMFPNTTRLVPCESPTEAEAEEEQPQQDGKKKSKKSAKKAARKAKAAETAKDDSDKGKEYQIENVAQMGEYVFGLMKEQQAYAIQQQQAFLQSSQPPPPPLDADAEMAESSTANSNAAASTTTGQGADMDIDRE